MDQIDRDLMRSVMQAVGEASREVGTANGAFKALFERKIEDLDTLASKASIDGNEARDVIRELREVYEQRKRDAATAANQVENHLTTLQTGILTRNDADVQALIGKLDTARAQIDAMNVRMTNAVETLKKITDVAGLVSKLVL